MVREKFPQDGQQALVAEQHFPRRFDEPDAIPGEVNTEFLVPEPFPRIQFKTAFDPPQVKVHKRILPGVPADVLR